MPTRTSAVAAHFAKASPTVRSTYEAILAAARRLGHVTEDPKKTVQRALVLAAELGNAPGKRAAIT